MTPLDCEDIEARALPLDYAAGRLAPELADAFEQHYLACPRCADAVAASVALGRAVKGASRPRPRARTTAWMGLAATLVVGVLGAALLRSPAAAPAPGASAPRRAEGAVPRAGDAEAWSRAAAFEMPRFTRPALRSSSREGAELEAARAAYEAGDWPVARARLTRLANKRSVRAEALFFLGAVELKGGQVRQAVSSFDAVIAEGDTPYLEEAHWYAAKAFFARRDALNARARLEALVRQEGDLAETARSLLKETEALPRR